MKPFKCYECGKGYSHNHTLNKHIKAVHERKKPFKCNDCNKAFSQKSTLNGHIESVHKGKKPFKCVCVCVWQSFFSQTHSKWAY